MIAARQWLVKMLRRAQGLGGQIAFILLVKTTLLGLLFSGLAPGPAQRRVDASLAATHLLAPPAPVAIARSVEDLRHGR